jgi:hypothetical protein
MAHMLNNTVKFFVGVLAVLGMFLGGCAATGSPAKTVERYLEAIVNKDVVAAADLSCLAWEEDAYAEASSFETVEVKLEGVTCRVVSEQDEYQKVACEGEIVANYGGEDQDIPLDSRVFFVIQEGGEWRMCGYEAP